MYKDTTGIVRYYALYMSVDLDCKLLRSQINDLIEKRALTANPLLVTVSSVRNYTQAQSPAEQILMDELLKINE